MADAQGAADESEAKLAPTPAEDPTKLTAGTVGATVAAAATDPSAEELRAKLKKRAERFGIEYSEQGELAVSAAARLTMGAPKRHYVEDHVPAASVDPFSPEELAKAEARTAKFGLTDSAAAAAEVAAAETARAAAAEAEEAKRRQRAARFGMEYSAPAAAPEADAGMGEDDGGGMEVDLLEQKRAPDEFAELRAEAVHVHGTDFMSTKDLFIYFQGYNPSYVEWINDSSANVVFAEGAAAKEAILGLLKEQPATPDGEASEGINIREFHDAKPYSKAAMDGTYQTVSDLSLRIATSSDVKVWKKDYVSRRLWEDDQANAALGGYQGKRRRRNRRNDHRSDNQVYGGHKRTRDAEGDVDMMDAHPDAPTGGSRSKRRRNRSKTKNKMDKDPSAAADGAHAVDTSQPSIDLRAKISEKNARFARDKDDSDED